MNEHPVPPSVSNYRKQHNRHTIAEGKLREVFAFISQGKDEKTEKGYTLLITE